MGVARGWSVIEVMGMDKIDEQKYVEWEVMRTRTEVWGAPVTRAVSRRDKAYRG